MDNLKIIPAQLKEAAGRIELENIAVQNISRQVNASLNHLPIGGENIPFDNISVILSSMSDVLNRTAQAFEDADKPLSGGTNSGLPPVSKEQD
ncbi:hypothetical protein JOD45_000146 [Scopulibacillus daqui]|uniref:Uncharacterized protein n=1 Tax=Scopulibacillus daqui TaxID=1469162 RepID=A0ABS2PVA5_9BACL|nr:hypothetical protein [Scopulibacillus daqui]MBM7643955.1 hypothetical protein [Scopulibacillus daqui]